MLSRGFKISTQGWLIGEYMGLKLGNKAGMMNEVNAVRRGANFVYFGVSLSGYLRGMLRK